MDAVILRGVSNTHPHGSVLGDIGRLRSHGGFGFPAMCCYYSMYNELHEKLAKAGFGRGGNAQRA